MEQDWAALNKYREENIKITQSSIWPEVVFMGDSITEAWANLHPKFFDSNNYLGRGIGGQTTPQMLIRFTADVLDLNPKAVVILGGTNDITENTGTSSIKMITDNIKAMAYLAEKKNIKVILSSVLPVNNYPWRPGLKPVSKIEVLKAWLQNFTQENGYVYLDYFDSLRDENKGLPKRFSEDGVHPNSIAYRIMEPLAIEAIKKALRNQ
ncbi:lysophospholipase L1-like esterase [Gramella sp. Hel_I_59]|uniref:SGNH/GDSL hydrolase family protein n=1 Tax=Gramella sp. Hel_I_59 TaxID=1249978 RepID=UPI00114D6392|nr:SGNH/GDSL hydrolase family protein [Gramella sp. Hel_I_59]TQI71438.1 lysophospholipase L1-like esterase [Gramella sp. Hel_I_59]